MGPNIGSWEGTDKPLLIFALTLAYHIWHMVLSLWEDLSCTFMIPDTTLTFDLKVKFIGFMTWLCVHATEFLSFHIVILCKCITMVQCVVYIHDFCMALIFDLNIFTMILRLTRSSLLSDIGIPNFAYGISPWNNMLFTFLAFVWPWFFTYMWVTGGISLLSFTHRFWNGLFIPLIDHSIRKWH